MNDFVIAILLIIGVATVLLLVRLLWYWMTGRLGTPKSRIQRLLQILQGKPLRPTYNSSQKGASTL